MKRQMWEGWPLRGSEVTPLRKNYPRVPRPDPFPFRPFRGPKRLGCKRCGRAFSRLVASYGIEKFSLESRWRPDQLAASDSAGPQGEAAFPQYLASSGESTSPHCQPEEQRVRRGAVWLLK